MNTPTHDEHLEVLALASLLGGLFNENEHLKSKLDSCSCDDDSVIIPSKTELYLARAKAKSILKTHLRAKQSTAFTHASKLRISRKLAAKKSSHLHKKRIGSRRDGYPYVTTLGSHLSKIRSFLANLRSKIIILCKTCFPRINTTKAAWILGFTLFFCLAPQCRSEWHPTPI